MVDVPDPELRIVDPHHHLWDLSALVPHLPNDDHPFYDMLRGAATYDVDDLVADLDSGHRVVATVFVECGTNYRPGGPPELRPVGETEFVAGVALGSVRPGVCAGIVASADMTLGNAVAPVLEAHVEAGGGLLRGIRDAVNFDADPTVLPGFMMKPPGLLTDPTFRAGVAQLERFGLSFDVLALEPQLVDVVDLARALPGVSFVLDHCGEPIGLGSYAGTLDERFPIWQQSMEQLAHCPNVTVKLGGLTLPLHHPTAFTNPGAAVLAHEWRRYIETCIELFGAERCMFESNYPVESAAGSYSTVWTAFELLAAGCSDGEREALFSGTASRVYRLDVTGES